MQLSFSYGLPRRNDWFVGTTTGGLYFRILTPLFQLDIMKGSKN